MNSPRIQDVWVGVSKGWWVVDDLTGARIPEKDALNSFHQLRSAIIQHRKANEKEWQPDQIEDMIHRQVCEREPEHVCKQQVWKGPNPNPPLTLGRLAANLAGELAKWAKQGFPVSSEAIVTQRMAICKACEFWLSRAEKCSKCGCKKWKLWMASAKCPVKKW